MARDATWRKKPYLIPHSDRVPLQVVRWSGDRVSISFTGSTARIGLPADTRLVELTATENCFIAFGDDTVDASSTIGAVSRLFMAGVQVVPVPIDPATEDLYKYIAAIQETAGGILQMERIF